MESSSLKQLSSGNPAAGRVLNLFPMWVGCSIFFKHTICYCLPVPTIFQEYLFLNKLLESDFKIIQIHLNYIFLAYIVRLELTLRRRTFPATIKLLKNINRARNRTCVPKSSLRLWQYYSRTNFGPDALRREVTINKEPHCTGYVSSKSFHSQKTVYSQAKGIKLEAALFTVCKKWGNLFFGEERGSIRD